MDFPDFTMLLPMAIAPALICAFYIYIRDKYEKEPIRLLLIGIIFGVIITYPIIHTENIVTARLPAVGKAAEAFYLSFIVAAFVEEGYKFILLYFLTWKNKNLNERFDGIVYAVFISLGFAGLENILYVLSPEMGGFETALMRAVYSVPGHAFFGVAMGYYFALSKFENHNRKSFMLKAFLVPWAIHGVYNFILLSGYKYFMFAFIPFLFWLWLSGFKKMRVHLEKSPFKKG